MKTPGPLSRRGKEGINANADRLVVPLLNFLAADDERLARFLSLSGLSVAALRRAAADPGFAGSLLDYVSSDERLLLAFSRQSGISPGDIEAIRLAQAPPPDP